MISSDAEFVRAAQGDDTTSLGRGSGPQRAVPHRDVRRGRFDHCQQHKYHLDDEAAPTLPDNSVIDANQAWKPSNYESSDFSEDPAPNPPNAQAALSGFDGADPPNGTWSLYVSDDVTGFSEEFTGG